MMSCSSTNDKESDRSFITSTDIDDVCSQPNLDGKKPPEVSTSAFLFTALVGVPIWLTVLAPLSIVYQTVNKVFPRSSSKPQEQDLNEKSFPQKAVLKPLHERKYDIVLLGSTGFTGSLTASYLAETYSTNQNIKWAICGRSPQKLADLKSNISQRLNDGKAVQNIDTIIVDTSMPSTIHDLVKDTKVVISTAGPFSKYGSRVVEFCARYGTSYVDITGEADWSKEMIMKWDDTAQKSGAKIVSFCGLDCIPSDLIVHQLSELMKKECNDELVHVKCCNDTKAGISGGTVDTMLTFIEGQYIAPRYDFDPFLKTDKGAKSSNKTKNRSLFSIRKHNEKGQWEGPWIMSNVNFELVKRTHALKDNTKNAILTYEESCIHKTFKEAFVNWFGLIIGLTSLLNPVTRIPVKKFLLPKPGEGPTPKQMKRGYMLISAEGKGLKGSKVEAAFYIPGDPGYKETARMVAESGLCLALDSKKLPVQGGGFFSPAIAMGDVLLERLCRTGSKFASKVVIKDGVLQSKL